MNAKKDVVSWKDKMAGDAKAVAKSERPETGRISLQSGVMTYEGNVIPNNTLTCVVIASAHENVIYKGDFDPGKVVAPDCFAISLDGKNMAPHEVVHNPITPTCGPCDMRKFKSAPNRKGKWCKEKRRLILLPIDKTASSPEDIAEAEMASMTIPVMSVGNWSAYVNQLSTRYDRPPWGVLTEITVVPDPKSQFKVFFKDLTTIEDDAALGAIHNRIEAAVEFAMTPYDMEMNDGEEQDQKEKKY